MSVKVEHPAIFNILAPSAGNRLTAHEREREKKSTPSNSVASAFSIVERQSWRRILDPGHAPGPIRVVLSEFTTDERLMVPRIRAKVGASHIK